MAVIPPTEWKFNVKLGALGTPEIGAISLLQNICNRMDRLGCNSLLNHESPDYAALMLFPAMPRKQHQAKRPTLLNRVLGLMPHLD